MLGIDPGPFHMPSLGTCNPGYSQGHFKIAHHILASTFPPHFSLPFRAVRRVVLTVDPTEARGTGTGVAVDAISAVGPIFAGVAGTFINILLALGAPETRQAVTEESVDAI